MKTFCVGAWAFVLAVTIGSQAFAAPDCTDPTGIWVNELGSTLDITNYDSATGAFSGTYVSPSGTQGTAFPLHGWKNHATPQPDIDNVHVFTFSVRWGDYGSVTAWTGNCREVDGTPLIEAMWHLARSNARFVWEHIVTNEDRFWPKAD